MTWTKLDDHADEHPKVEGLSDAAFRLWLSGLIYANRNNTDGKIPKARALRLTATASQEAVREILGAVLWHETPDAYLIHDFLDYNPSKADVEARRAEGRERTQRWRQTKAGDAVRDASQTAHDTRHPGSGKVVSKPPVPTRRNTSRDASQTPSQPEHVAGVVSDIRSQLRGKETA